MTSTTPSPVAGSRQVPSESAQSFEEGSSSGETSDGYVTPDEYIQDEVVPPTRHPDEETREALSEADDLKAEGTEYFRAGKWAEALQTYRRGVARLPPRKDSPQEVKGKGKARGDGQEDDNPDEPDEEDGEDEAPAEEGESTVASLSALEQECAKARSVLYGNIGACFVKLEEHKEAVQACTQALLDDPQYVKALHRRATSNDTLGTWSSLAAAEEDYNALLKLLSPASPLLPQIRIALHRVKPRREAAQKAEMGEMVDKLKGLGDSVLGNFGLSTNNFKFEPNGQGGYSINFVR